LEAGNEVCIFDKNPSRQYDNLVIRGDVRDPETINQAVKGSDIIYHLAAEHHDDVRPVSLYYDVNVEGAKNVIRAADDRGVKKIIFTSTVAVYGLNKVDPNENTPAEPFNDYGRSKLEAEKVFNRWAEQGGGRGLVIVRPVVIFGEGNQGNVYTLIKQIASGRFVMVGSGENRKSMGYVGNIVKFLVGTAELKEGRHLFNYVDKPDMTVKELVQYIRAELNIMKTLPTVPYAAGIFAGYIFDLLSLITGKSFPISSIRIKKFCANTTVSARALDELGFEAPFSLKTGLKLMINSIKAAG
jgi:nucleoside-diphosphate-sugar epimerase